MSKDWRSWFEPKILDRGYNYFLKENVMDLKKTAGGYQAFVMGTRMYTHSIHSCTHNKGLIWVQECILCV